MQKNEGLRPKLLGKRKRIAATLTHKSKKHHGSRIEIDQDKLLQGASGKRMQILIGHNWLGAMT